jgi:hypothetical protein
MVGERPVGVGRTASGANIRSRGSDMAYAGSWRVRFVQTDGFGSASGEVGEPSHVGGDIESLVRRKSQRDSSIEDEFRVLLVARTRMWVEWRRCQGREERQTLLDGDLVPYMTV